MSVDQINQNASSNTDLQLTCMESVNRFSKLPVVDCSIKTATSIYEKVKDYNSLTQWTLSTAESSVYKALEVGKPIASPVIKNLEGSIKKIDGALCTGLDYVETKVPAVKLPPSEIYHSTKDYVANTVTPAVVTAKSYADPALKTAKYIVEPAFERAKSAVEPALERARNIVEPLVQPAFDKANAIKEDVLNRVDEYLQHIHKHGNINECEECQEIRRKTNESEHQHGQEQHQQQEQEQNHYQQHQQHEHEHNQ